MDLNDHIDTKVRVQFVGGREVVGILKGYDQLSNLVIDACTEYLRSDTDSTVLSGESRDIGLVICRGTAVSVITQEDGSGDIDNPFR